MKEPYRASILSTFLICLFALLFCGENSGICQEWSESKIKLLPDSCFAMVEIEKGQKVRHSPHHDANGKLDKEQLITVLGTFDSEIWVDQANRERARKHLNQHYDKFMTKVIKEGLHGSININQAKLTELVALPQIGPVFAVKIIDYRNSVSSFATIEQIKEVDGIGSATFNAIKFYIDVD